MADNMANIINEEDSQILLGECNFSDSFFDLEETFIPTGRTEHITPIDIINNNLKDCNGNIKIAHINARSISKHIHEITRVVQATTFDVIGVSETFIKKDTPKNLIKIEGYTLFNKNRTGKCGGGVGLYVINHMKAKLIKLPQEIDQPEIIFIELSTQHSKMAVGVCYKPPKIPYGVFAMIQETLAYITTKYIHTVIIGDFNINYLKPESLPVNFLQVNIGEPFGLKQIINNPTRVTLTSSTLIDLVFVSNSSNVKKSGVVDIPGISDHCLVYIAYAIKKAKFKPKIITSRDFRKFSEHAFKRDMELGHWGNIYAVDESDIDSQVTIVENIFTEIINKHAPFRTFKAKHPPSPWLNEKIKQMMGDRDTLKNTFNINKDLRTYEKYKILRNKVNHAIRQAKIDTFNNEINSKLKFAKEYHNALKRHNVVESRFLDTTCNYDANSLNETFTYNNNSEVDDVNVNFVISEILKESIAPVFNFNEVTEQDIIKIVRSLKSNSCGTDNISAFFIKLSIEFSVYAITYIINNSFKYRTFPKQWKKAVVKPIPKKENPTSGSDFRPISLLPVFSKISEKVGCYQINKYFNTNVLFDILQSAYKQFHSTTTALINIVDDIYKALDKSELTILILLDYSKAFDCANHRLILAKLKALGFHDDALAWILSYLTDRTQKVKTNTGESRWVTLKNGVPQGSVLGPLLFTVLVSDVKKVIEHGKYHLYADDTQLYYNGKVNDVVNLIDKINHDLAMVEQFSKNNCLKLNTTKSNFIIIGSSSNLVKLKKIYIPPLIINNKIIERKMHVRNLGITFDEVLSWTKHVNILVGKAYGKLKQGYRFRKFLSQEAKINLCEYYVLSQFNYCDVVYQNISDFLKLKIQKVQNNCFRFIFGLRKYDHISDCFQTLDTLNMEERRILHGLTLMHKINKKLAPRYLCDRIVHHSDNHKYNTRFKDNLVTERCWTSKRKNSFFSKFVLLYNNLSIEVGFNDITLSTFKKRIKKYLKTHKNK